MWIGIGFVNGTFHDDRSRQLCAFEGMSMRRRDNTSSVFFNELYEATEASSKRLEVLCDFSRKSVV